jgi:EAL domain-containing protein (putative c-di-GMP-specific phosphodiesterase class I)
MSIRLLNTYRSNTEARLAINLSGHSVENGTFMGMLLTLLKQHRAVLPRLMFEVTETAEIDDLEAANRILQNLRRLGAAVCIDDFGSGSASFQYLNSMDVDYLKIDGSYVTGMRGGNKEHAMLQAMAGLCRSLRIKTIAEMIETAESAEALKTIGIDLGQGYFFHRPAPLNEVLADVPERAAG